MLAMTESETKCIEAWTSVDQAALDTDSKFIRLSYRDLGSMAETKLQEIPYGAHLDLSDVTRRSHRFWTVVRRASETGCRLVVEVHDRNPVKTISSHPIL
jgi:hypothetical protein